MKQPTLQQFKAWARSHYSLAHAVCAAKAFAQLERERVDAYIKPVFDSYGFTDESDNPIADVAHLYRCNDVKVDDFFEDCDREHRKHGFTGPHGHCPALTAEHLLVIAENALIDAAGPLFGVDFGAHCHLETREKLLDLLLGACLKREAA